MCQTLSLRGITCAPVQTVCVYTDKAAGLLFSVTGYQHTAVELKHNSVRVCVLCLLVCPFYLP